MHTLDLKNTAVCINSANRWVEDWFTSKELDDGKYVKEITMSLRQAHHYMFGKDEPIISKELQSLVTNSRSIQDYYICIRKYQDIFIYLMAVSSDRYMTVNNKDYKFWRKEEDAVKQNDPSDLPFL